MAKTQQKDILSQFRDLGSEALHRLQDVPGGSKLMEMANESRSRLDEIQKRLRGLDELEKRVAKLERQLAVQPKKPAAKARKTTARKSSSPRRVTTPKPPT
jgi:BMFP domain-containing protein YqiC